MNDLRKGTSVSSGKTSRESGTTGGPGCDSVIGDSRYRTTTEIIPVSSRRVSLPPLLFTSETNEEGSADGDRPLASKTDDGPTTLVAGRQREVVDHAPSPAFADRLPGSPLRAHTVRGSRREGGVQVTYVL